MTYGYIRVSSKDQNVDRQRDALRKYDILEENIYTDRQSGKDFTRPAYQKMISVMKRGDLLIVKSIDRLGRNYDEILQQWRYITKEIGADMFVIDMPLLDTRVKCGDLTGTFIADLVLQILAYVAQTEREFIRQRQAEGISSAKARGVKFGRKAMKRPEEYKKIKIIWKQGKISAREAARRLSVTHKTFLRWVRDDEKIG